jgi:predicted phosphodiesterase
MIAILSDIHANYEALKAVMEHIRNQDVDEIICLGDVVGYGPAPEDCLKEALKSFSVTLCGNHEWAILNEALGFNIVARQAVDWTRKALQPKWYSSRMKKNCWEFMHNMPQSLERGKFLFVHASPTHPTEEYLLRSDVETGSGDLSPKVQRSFDNTKWVAFIGHTHTPGIITEDGRFLVPKEIGNFYRIKPGRKCIINVGSVGQPRDTDNRACYVTLDRGKVVYNRVDYNVESTYKLVLSNASLDNSLGERLLSGT